MELITPHDSIFMSYLGFTLYKGFTRQIVDVTSLLQHLHLVAAHMPDHADKSDSREKPISASSKAMPDIDS